MKTSRAAALQLLAFAAVLGGVFWLSHIFPLVSWVSDGRRWVESFGPRSGAVYPLLYAACNLLLLPGGVLTIGGGFLFGLRWGFFLVLVGNLLGAAGAFLISRLLGRRWVEKRLAAHPRWRRLDEIIERDGWKMIVLSQLHPLFPTSLLNYLYGVTKMRFWPCMFWIAVGQAPGLFCYVYLGTLGQFGLNLLQGRSHPHPIEYALWIGGLVLTIGVTSALARLSLGVLKELDEPVSPKETPLPLPAILSPKPAEEPAMKY